MSCTAAAARLSGAARKCKARGCTTNCLAQLLILLHQCRPLGSDLAAYVAISFSVNPSPWLSSSRWSQVHPDTQPCWVCSLTGQSRQTARLNILRRTHCMLLYIHTTAIATWLLDAGAVLLSCPRSLVGASQVAAYRGAARRWNKTRYLGLCDTCGDKRARTPRCWPSVML